MPYVRCLGVVKHTGEQCSHHAHVDMDCKFYCRFHEGQLPSDAVYYKVQCPHTKTHPNKATGEAEQCLNKYFVSKPGVHLVCVYHMRR